MIKFIQYLQSKINKIFFFQLSDTSLKKIIKKKFVIKRQI